MTMCDPHPKTKAAKAGERRHPRVETSSSIATPQGTNECRPTTKGCPQNGSPEGEISNGARTVFDRCESEEGTVWKVGQDRPENQWPHPRSAPEGIPAPERVGVERHPGASALHGRP